MTRLFIEQPRLHLLIIFHEKVEFGAYKITFIVFCLQSAVCCLLYAVGGFKKMECFWIAAEREIVYLKPHTQKKMIYVKSTHMLLVIFFIFVC